MNFDESLNNAAREYAESCYSPEEVTNPEYQFSIDSVAETFADGARWSMSNQNAQQEQLEKMAHEYARNVVESPDENLGAVEDVANDFTEGAIWYTYEHHSLQKNTFHKILNFFLNTVIGKILGFIILWFAFAGLIIIIDRLIR